MVHYWGFDPHYTWLKAKPSRQPRHSVFKLGGLLLPRDACRLAEHSFGQSTLCHGHFGYPTSLVMSGTGYENPTRIYWVEASGTRNIPNPHCMVDDLSNALSGA